MTTSLMNPVIHQLRRAVLLPDGAGLTDGQLLESFARQKNEAAFEVLVRRHWCPRLWSWLYRSLFSWPWLCWKWLGLADETIRGFRPPTEELMPLRVRK
jgi:hypothetical protein